MKLIIRSITSGYKTATKIQRSIQEIEVELVDMRVSELEQVLKFEQWLNTNTKSRFHIEVRDK